MMLKAYATKNSALCSLKAIIFFFFDLSGLASAQKKSFSEDLDEIDALFNGSRDESMFDFNPDKGSVSVIAHYFEALYM